MRLAAALVACVLAGSAAAQTVQPVEQEQFYSIEGTTGPELYMSIGENGPQVGIGRAIAYTDFDLKWRRDYRPQADGSCRLVSALSFLTITYRLPKPRAALSGPTAGLWATFIDGIRRHEKVHGQQITEMAQRILDTTVGLTVADDPGCTKIRQAMQAPLEAASLEQRQRSRDFDRAEMSEGGTVHRLVLNLVNTR